MSATARWCSAGSGDDTRKLIDETLEIVGLGALRDRYPAQLSGGQKQRVALARAIICEPKVILLDEPLAALDATLRRQMQVFLKQIQRRIDTTFVFVTHDQDEAITMSDRIVVMNLGRIEQVGTPQRPLLPPAHPLRGRLLRRQQPDRRDRVGCERMSTPPLGRFLSQTVSGITRGAKVLVGIRPESLAARQGRHLHRSRSSTDSMFGGALTKLLLRPDTRPVDDPRPAALRDRPRIGTGAGRPGQRHL